MKVNIKSIKNILVIQTFQGIGDYLVTLEFFEKLYEIFPQASIDILIRNISRFKPLLKYNPYINNIIIYDKNKKHRSIFNQLKLLSYLKKTHYDIGFTFHPAPRYILTMFLAKIKYRIGYCKNNVTKFLMHEIIPPYKNKAVIELYKNGYIHAIINSLSMLIPFGKKPVFKPTDKPILNIPYFELPFNIPKNKIKIAIAPSANTPKKEWGYEKFTLLLERLSKIYNAFFIIIGTPDEKKRFYPLYKKYIKNSLLLMDEKYDLTIIARVLLEVHLAISNDHGIVHLTAALAKPVISLGPVYPDVWGPWSKKSSYLRANINCIYNCPGADICPDYRCCKEINVEEVINEVKKLLNET